MTNKVKPFYIKITDDMTPQMVQDALDRCIAVGAEWHNDTKTDPIHIRSYFGVCGSDGTYLSNSVGAYNCDEDGNEPQEITLDQLDEWLGVKSEVDWEYGNIAERGASEFIYVAPHPTKIDRSICVHPKQGATYCIPTDELSKPETPEQRAERERLEDIAELSSLISSAPTSIRILPETLAERLYNLGYRKQ